ncbi:MAG: acetyl-CoA carboxylase biotin carboxylase subunit, partial [Bacteroidota bacterium]
ANRGEIAVRIIRTCKELGIETVAVCSEVDRLSIHSQIADRSYLLGGASPSESYLDIEKIVAAARHTGCDAIHPGYGFLAENAEFAEAVSQQGFTFVGPTADAIRAMGDKPRARKLARSVGVPVVPGSDRDAEHDDDISRGARNLGYPVMVKPSAGGGGKGMRIVRSEKDLPSALRGARSEALSAFGDDRVYIEKFLESPCHIEFQVLADAHGQIIQLGERECSIQRRHQKIIEESPSRKLNQHLRESMAKAAVLIAKSCNYLNAGTVEFLLDGGSNFYFLEMNTRLQVEHPVTEMVTGVDMVREQLKIAQGERLSFVPDDIRCRGHAIECRIYAEDPYNSFFPSTGRLTRLRAALGPGVREDCGVEEGGEIMVYYDPLISKLIAWSGTREGAIARMKRALEEYQVSGVETTVPFCLYVMDHPDFQAGTYDTGFVEHRFQVDSVAREDALTVVAAVSSACLAEWENRASVVLPGFDGKTKSRWRSKRFDSREEERMRWHG